MMRSNNINVLILPSHTSNLLQMFDEKLKNSSHTLSDLCGHLSYLLSVKSHFLSYLSLSLKPPHVERYGNTFFSTNVYWAFEKRKIYIFRSKKYNGKEKDLTSWLTPKWEKRIKRKFACFFDIFDIFIIIILFFGPPIYIL